MVDASDVARQALMLLKRLGEKFLGLKDDIREVKARMSMIERKVSNHDSYHGDHFGIITARLDRFDERLERIEQRLDLVESRPDRITRRIPRLDTPKSKPS